MVLPSALAGIDTSATAVPQSIGSRNLLISLVMPARVQECIMPRCLFSMEDAVFCAHFMRRLGAAKVRDTPGHPLWGGLPRTCITRTILLETEGEGGHT